MSDTLTTDDIKDVKADRDADGELIPETHDIDWGGESKRVETVPITTGVVNELSHIDKEIANLKPSAVYEAFKTLYVDPDPDTFSESDIEDLGFEYLEALMSPLDEQMEMDIDGDGGNMSVRQERARDMR